MKRVRFETEQGVPVLCETSHALPLVDFEVLLRSGSVHDPLGKEGLLRMTWRLARMGTGTLASQEFEEAIARLGARLAIETSTSFVRVHGTVIRKNLREFMSLVAEMLQRPAMRTADLAQVKREALADLVAARDSDRSVAARHFRRFLFGDHPYGRPIIGTRSSVRSLKLDDIRDCYRRHFVAQNTIMAFCGDVTSGDARTLADEYFSNLPTGRAPRERVAAPRLGKGRRVLLIDKPDRTQAQIYIGGLGCKVGDPEYFPLLVGNLGFGGTFTARLMNEVRVKRGWSYGAYSRLGQDRQRDAWFMWSSPALKDAVDCIDLELDLMQRWVDSGLTTKEHRAAKKYLVNSHCFDIDTAPKRLEQHVDEVLFDLPEGYHDRYMRHVRSVTRAGTHAAIQKRIDPDRQVIVALATVKAIEKRVEQLPGVTSIERVRYDAD